MRPSLELMSMDNESLQQQIKELEDALREANDENIELRGALSKTADPFTMVRFSIITVIHENLHGGTIVFPVPTNLVGKAKIATLLRQAANNIMKTTLEE